MAISLLSDVMGSREKLQLALSGCRDDTGCIEIIAALRGAANKKPRIAPGLSEALVFASGRHLQRRILLEINTGNDPP